MADMEPRSKNLRTPDDTVQLPGIIEDLVDLGDLTVGRTVQQPGWRWSTHSRPIVGGDWCQAHHVGVVLSGRFGAELKDGTVLDLEPDDVYDIPPDHDGYTIGDEPCVLLEWSGLSAFLGEIVLILKAQFWIPVRWSWGHHVSLVSLGTSATTRRNL